MINIPADEAEAQVWEARVLNTFPLVEEVPLDKCQLILLRDGRLLRLPEGKGHRTMCDEFAKDMPIFFAKTGAIRVYLSMSGVSVDLLVATQKQREVILGLLSAGKRRRLTVQRFRWEDCGISACYRSGPCIDQEYYTIIRAAADLNKFLDDTSARTWSS